MIEKGLVAWVSPFGAFKFDCKRVINLFICLQINVHRDSSHSMYDINPMLMCY